jgi:predicted RNA-binding Zn-ribbon protein involved in translation (DUF1610 family)
MNTLPTCPICEVPMVPKPPGQSERFVCPECGAQALIPGGSHRIVSPGIGESDQVDSPGMQAKDGGRRT